MKKTICLFLVIVLCFSIMPTCYASAENASFSDDPKAIQVASNSVIMLSCYDKDGNLYATGSAFAAFEGGVFVTNCHVIEKEVYAIRAKMETGLEFSINSVVAYDAEKDLAILRTEAKTGLDPLPLGSSAALERGEKVIAIGSPLGLINTLSIGLYSGALKDERIFLQFSAAISHGSSGGALFNNKGEVIGITSASYTEGQNLNLAIPIEDAVELWENCEKDNELSIADFYEEWEHIKEYSVSYILSHQSEFSSGMVIRTEGYVFIDPRSFKNKNNDFFLIETLLDYNAVCDALEELNSCGGFLSDTQIIDALDRVVREWDLDNPIVEQLQLEMAYEKLLSNRAISVVSIEKQPVSRGVFIVIQGEIVRSYDIPHLENITIIE